MLKLRRLVISAESSQDFKDELARRSLKGNKERNREIFHVTALPSISLVFLRTEDYQNQRFVELASVTTEDTGDVFLSQITICTDNFEVITARLGDPCPDPNAAKPCPHKVAQIQPGITHRFFGYNVQDVVIRYEPDQFRVAEPQLHRFARKLSVSTPGELVFPIIQNPQLPTTNPIMLENMWFSTNLEQEFRDVAEANFDIAKTLAVYPPGMNDVGRPTISLQLDQVV